MKHLKSINEYHRTVGFRYSEPKESYIVSILCRGNDIISYNINNCLAKVTDLKFKPDETKIQKFEEPMMVELKDGMFQVNAVVDITITVYNDKEINAIVEELDRKLDFYNIQVVDFKYKENLED